MASIRWNAAAFPNPKQMVLISDCHSLTLKQCFAIIWCHRDWQHFCKAAEICERGGSSHQEGVAFSPLWWKDIERSTQWRHDLAKFCMPLGSGFGHGVFPFQEEKFHVYREAGRSCFLSPQYLSILAFIQPHWSVHPDWMLFCGRCTWGSWPQSPKAYYQDVKTTCHDWRCETKDSLWKRCPTNRLMIQQMWGAEHPEMMWDIVRPVVWADFQGGCFLEVSIVVVCICSLYIIIYICSKKEDPIINLSLYIDTHNNPGLCAVFGILVLPSQVLLICQTNWIKRRIVQQQSNCSRNSTSLLQVSYHSVCKLIYSQRKGLQDVLNRSMILLDRSAHQSSWRLVLLHKA